MTSFIYLYSKFTEEFLLLSAAGIFFLLAVYCYHYVVKKRRLGAARDQIPAGMVRVYLNQLIQEAQGVRTQLFGLLGNEALPEGGAKFNLQSFQAPSHVAAAPAASGDASNSAPVAAGAGIPSDLLERLKALENQLSQKEGMVINVNIEKAKLLEEIENLKQNQHAQQAAAPTATDNSDLINKIKGLEERLEEYALFEDDLANLKRLQQENAALKKKLADTGSDLTIPGGAGDLASTAKTVVAASKPEPKLEMVPPPKPEVQEPAVNTAPSLNQDAIDALLEGASPVAPDAAKAAAPKLEAVPDAVEPVATKASADDFEKLVDRVENSLTKEEPRAAKADAPAAASAPVTAAAPQAPAGAPEAAPREAAAPKAEEFAASKTDEELLKEFESLLNS